MRNLTINPWQKVLVLLLMMLFGLQFSSLPLASAQGGDKDGGEAGYVEQPSSPPDSLDMSGNISSNPVAGKDPWFAEESKVIPQPSAQGQIQDVVTPTLTLNVGHTGYYDLQTGKWIDDTSVAAYLAGSNLSGEVKLRPYYQEKSQNFDQTELTFRSGITLQLAPHLAPAVLQQLTTAQRATSQNSYYLIQFSYPFPIEAREQLEAVGVEFFDPVGPTGFYIKIPPQALSVLQDLVTKGVVRHVGEIPLEAKLDPNLISGTTLTLNTVQDVVVLTFEEPSPAQLQELSRIFTIERRSDGPMHILVGKASNSSIQTLATLDYVRWVEKKPINTIANFDGNMAIGSDVIRSGSSGFNGTGINVMIVDTGIARSGTTYHPDLLADRILDQYNYQNNNNNAADDNSHGTHVAGTIGGRYNSSDGNSQRSTQGIAPGVNFYIYKLCCGVNQFASDWFQAALQRGTSSGRVTHISNNSWGGGNGVYNINSEIADRAVLGVYNGQRINMVMISHNQNSLTSAPGTGKNVITVGAIKDGNYPDQIRDYGVCSEIVWPPAERDCFSNYGPIDTDNDGRTRVKPDIMAPGSMIRSTGPWYLSGFDYYYDSSGTSMAAPHVSGAIAQILDAYSDSAPWLLSWPETVKALLLATTMDVGGDTNLYGRGLVNPYHAIYSQSGISSATFWNSTINSGEIKDFTFDVPSGYQELRIALTWSDPAGSPEVSQDIDISEIIDASGVNRGASTSFDDTVEYVTIPAGYPAGTWTIRVNAFSVSSTQRLGLAVHRLLANANLGIAPSVEYIPSSTISVAPGDYFYLHQYVSNNGFAAGGGYARLNVPSGFTVSGVRVYTADDYSYFYDASQIYHPAGTLLWRIALGETISGYTRHVRWYIQANSTIALGNYNFLSRTFWREKGATNSSTEITSVVTVARPIATPTNLQASAVSQSQINLTWQDNSSDESNFRVERSPNGSTGWTEIATVGANITGYNNVGLTAGTTYYYRVRAYRLSDGQYSSYSNTAGATTNPAGADDPPVDVYFLVDLSGSFSDDLPVFKAQAPTIISTLRASNSNIRFGLGKFEDYPISPFGSTAYGDKAYERLVDLTFDTNLVLNTINGLYTRWGDDEPESQLTALYQTATGAGQNLSGVGYPGASIPAGQQANFRSGATKLIILWTDASFHRPEDPGDIPYPGFSFTQVTIAIKTLGNSFVYGIYSGGAGLAAANNQQNVQSIEVGDISIENNSDLKTIVAATGAFASDAGVDCNNDGVIDILRGQPLVCGIGASGQGIGDAVIALVEAERGPALVFLPLIRKN